MLTLLAAMTFGTLLGINISEFPLAQNDNDIVIKINDERYNNALLTYSEVSSVCGKKAIKVRVTETDLLIFVGELRNRPANESDAVAALKKVTGAIRIETLCSSTGYQVLISGTAGKPVVAYGSLN